MALALRPVLNISFFLSLCARWRQGDLMAMPQSATPTWGSMFSFCRGLISLDRILLGVSQDIAQTNRTPATPFNVLMS
jgi:hypothetical protein